MHGATSTMARFNTCIHGKKDDKPACVPRSIKLQNIEVPKFNGNLNSWMAFYDLFKIMVHENDELNKHTKNALKVV